MHNLLLSNFITPMLSFKFTVAALTVLCYARIFAMLFFSHVLPEERAHIDSFAHQKETTMVLSTPWPETHNGNDRSFHIMKKSTGENQNIHQKKAIACRNASIKWIHVGKWAKQANDEIIKAIQSSSGMSGSGNCNREIQILDAAEHFIPFYLRPESSCGYDENWDSVLKVIRKIMDEKPKSLPLAMCIVASDEADRSYSITFGFDAIAVGSINCHQGMEAKHCHWIK